MGKQIIHLHAKSITIESFKPFGQVVYPQDDGKQFDHLDAQLHIPPQGQPRFYIMHLPKRGRRFHRITYHAKVTQCLGALAPVQDWYLAVAAPTMSVDKFPQPNDVHVFRIPHGVFVKLEAGTWHAGPLFDGDGMDFYNLELSDTNITDHNTHDYLHYYYLGEEEKGGAGVGGDGLEFEILDDQHM
jgi:ureidoglycolate hydrolase